MWIATGLHEGGIGRKYKDAAIGVGMSLPGIRPRAGPKSDRACVMWGALWAGWLHSY